MKHPLIPCPVCGQMLVRNTDDAPSISRGYVPYIYCKEVVRTQDGREYNHYLEDIENNQVVITLPPYRIINRIDNRRGHSFDKVSQVGIRSRYKTGERKYYFKTILTVPELHPDTEESLRNRIKTLLVFS